MEGSPRRQGDIVLVFEILEDGRQGFHWRARSADGVTLMHALQTFPTLEDCISDACQVATARPAV